MGRWGVGRVGRVLGQLEEGVYFNVYLLGALCVPGLLLGTGERAVNKR